MELFAFFPLVIFGGIGVLLLIVAAHSRDPGLVLIAVVAFVAATILTTPPPDDASWQTTNATPTTVPIPCLSSYGWNCTYLNQSDTSAGFVCLPKNTQGAGP